MAQVKISGEVKVGLLTLISGIVLYVGFNYLKGIDFFDPTDTYYAVYDDIEGLTVSNPVKISGSIVGRVASIKLLQGSGNKLLVGIDVREDVVLNDSTFAVLGDDGLLGGKKIDLLIKKGSRNLSPNDTLYSVTSEGLTKMLSSKAEPMMAAIDTTLATLNSLLKEYQGMSTEVRKIMANTAQLTGGVNGIVADNRQQLAATMANLNRLSASLVETEKSIKPLMGKMNTFADSLNAMKLASTMANANKALASLQQTLKAVEQGQGTVGKLVHNDSLYNNLNHSLASLDSLLMDMKARPKRYVHFSVFGRKDKEAKK